VIPGVVAEGPAMIDMKCSEIRYALIFKKIL
jgi:hypothetical protein